MSVKNEIKMNYFKSFLRLKDISKLEKEEKIATYIKTYPYLKGMEKDIFETENDAIIKQEINSSDWKYFGYMNGLINEIDIIRDEKFILKNLMIKNQKIKFKKLDYSDEKKEKLVSIITYGLNKESEKSHLLNLNNDGVLYFLNNCNLPKRLIIDNVYLTDKNIKINVLLDQAHLLEDNDFHHILDFSKKSGNLSKLLFVLIKKPEIITNRDIDIILEKILTVSKEYEYLAKDILMSIAGLKEVGLENKRKFFTYAYVVLTKDDIVFLAEKNNLWLTEADLANITKKYKKYQVLNLTNNQDKEEEYDKVEVVKTIARYKALEGNLNLKDKGSETEKIWKI